MLKIGFIDYYLDEWHANKYPQMIAEASNGEMTVANAFALIDAPNGKRTTKQWGEDMDIAICSTIEELIEKSDVLVVLSPDNCEMHEQLCQLPLRSGKLTYVDKTFAPDGETARRIFAIAEASGTPCYSTSALRFATEYQDIDRAKVQSISTWGPNGFETYAIHQLEPIMMLMPGKPTRVMATKTESNEQILIEFDNGGIATLNCFHAGSPFMANIATTEGNHIVNVESDFFGGFIRALVKFFRTGVVEVPHETTLSIMDVRGAGLKALAAPGEWISING